MASKILLGRLEALRKGLMAGHEGSVDVSSYSMGRDRELFINMILSNIISLPFRIGTGDILGSNENMSRQCDIVIEYMNTLSFPNIYPSAARLYLAESVCAVVEVKSTILTQWQNVVSAANELAKLERDPGTIAEFKAPPRQVPFFAVGYRGWKDPRSIQANLETANSNGLTISGVLQFDPCIYVGAGSFTSHSNTGPAAIYGFLLSIEELTSNIIGAKPHFSRYVK